MDVASHPLAWISGADRAHACGVAVVVHGLNFPPPRMSSLVECLNEMGCDAFVCALRGHGSNYPPLAHCTTREARMAAFQRVHCSTWLQDVQNVARQAAEHRRRSGDVPLILVAYSLGALIGCLLQTMASYPIFDRMALFAPALRIQPYGHIFRPLSFFPRLVIPSLTPPAYRENRGTPIAAYRALYEAIDHLGQQSLALLNVPTLVFIDPQDELVSYRNVAAIAQRKTLNRWRLLPVEKGTGAAQRYHHLITDEASVGPAVWARMMKRLDRHLIGNPSRLASIG